MQRNFNLKSYAALIAFAFAIFSAAATGEEIDANQYRSIRWSYFNGQKYAFGLSKDVCRTMKTWHLDNGDPPPVTPKEAHRLAKAWIDKLKVASRWKWELMRLSLVPIEPEEGKWLWEVSFTYTVTEGGQTGQPVEMHVRITMDGKVILPVISDDRR